MANRKNVVVGVAIAIVLVIIIAVVAKSFQKIASHEVGVKYDIHSRSLSSDITKDGLHVGPPGFRFIKFPRVFKMSEFPGYIKCLDKDGVTVSLLVSYQYRPRFADLQGIIAEFRDYETYKKIIARIGEAAIHDTCSTFDTSQFQTHRGDFQKNLVKHMSQMYEVIRCDISELQVNDILRPSEFDKSVEAKEEAREDIKVAKQEAPKLITMAETRNKTATKEGEIIVEKASSAARIKMDDAEKQAESIEHAYRQEADTYKNLMHMLKFGPEELLSYLSVRNIQYAKRTVNVAIKDPASTI